MSEFRSIDEALKGTVDAIWQSGHTASPRSLETKEVLGWGFHLANPRNRLVSLKSRRWSSALAVGELCWHLSGSDDVGFISYYCPVWGSFSEDGCKIRGSCYGKRIFGASQGRASQWDLIKRTLRQDPESRRAVLTLYSADQDLPRATALDQPCMATVQFLLRGNRLHCFTNMRSNDVIWGLCYDVYLVTMLQELLALELGAEFGGYYHTASSMHLYKNFYPMAEKILAEPLPEEPVGMQPMSHPEEVPSFLQAEAQFRAGLPEATLTLERLHPYWRNLAAPLVARRSSVEAAAQVAA